MTLIAGLSFLLVTTATLPESAPPTATPRVELAVGYTVKNRELEAVDGDNVFLDGDKVVVWSAVHGLPAGYIEHVWYHDGVEVARHYLPVGAARRWRTWSRHDVEVGDYRVEVRGADGTVLDQVTFEVDAACGE